MQSYFKTYLAYYKTKLDNILRDEIDVSLVLYDEVEYFRKWHDPLFAYPYIQRKNMITNKKFKINVNTDGDYEYFKT